MQFAYWQSSVSLLYHTAFESIICEKISDLRMYLKYMTYVHNLHSLFLPRHLFNTTQKLSVSFHLCSLQVHE